mmetsp:Transcript_8304/g.25640  ORF Transcript_8304/g.25640 Transcript_8304/m.25640 type:complete len:203 (+) Transcript_8304:491-1099(+)
MRFRSRWRLRPWRLRPLHGCLTRPHTYSPCACACRSLPSRCNTPPPSTRTSPWQTWPSTLPMCYPWRCCWASPRRPQRCSHPHLRPGPPWHGARASSARTWRKKACRRWSSRKRRAARPLAPGGPRLRRWGAACELGRHGRLFVVAHGGPSRRRAARLARPPPGAQRWRRLRELPRAQKQSVHPKPASFPFFLQAPAGKMAE